MCGEGVGKSMKKHIVKIILSVILAISCSGCSLAGMNPQALMSPPKATGDRAAIHDLLEDSTGAEFTLRYPYSGDNRSAIVLRDFTGDHVRDAIATYVSPDGNGTTIAFMTCKNGKWKVVRKFTNSATQVDKICFGDLNGDGKEEVIVGWGSPVNRTSSISVYNYTSKGIVEIPLNINYGTFDIANINGSRSDELFVATVFADKNPAIARIIKMNERGTLETLATAELDKTVVEYVKITSGLINAHQKGIVLDGIRADSIMVTQLLYWNSEDKTLEAPFSDKASQSMNITRRNPAARYTSRDVNGDGIIEFPIVTEFPGYPEGTNEPLAYLVHWQRFDTKDEMPICAMSTVINAIDGYWFLFPDAWKGKVTCKGDAKNHSMAFYRWINKNKKDKNGAVGAVLLRIKIFAKSDWNSSTDSHGYTKLLEQNNMVYAAMIPSPSDKLAPTMSDVSKSFNVLPPE